jgi:hypothetical protein
MNRLRHSAAAFKRTLQISTTDFFVYVEGRNADRYIYDKLAAEVCQPRALKWQVTAVEETFVATGGKTGLARLFLYLRRSSLLDLTFKSKRTVVVFIADKDVDDILRKRFRSPNFIYTTYHSIENHIVKQSKFHEAIASATGLDTSRVKTIFPDVDSWMLQMATIWKDWVIACVLVARLQIRCPYSYASTSILNKPPTAPVSPIEVTRIFQTIRAASCLTPEEFDRRLVRATELVNRLYACTDHDKIFKGKWYVGLLEEDIKTKFFNVPHNKTALYHRLLSSLTATADVRHPAFSSMLSALDRAL